MNDFTKEELDFIFKYMIQCGSRDNLSKYNLVLIKLKTLVDNYCEHKLMEKSYIYADVCEVCNRVLNHAGNK